MKINLLYKHILIQQMCQRLYSLPIFTCLPTHFLFWGNKYFVLYSVVMCPVILYCIVSCCGVSYLIIFSHACRCSSELEQVILLHSVFCVPPNVQFCFVTLFPLWKKKKIFHKEKLSAKEVNEPSKVDSNLS